MLSAVNGGSASDGTIQGLLEAVGMLTRSVDDINHARCGVFSAERGALLVLESVRGSLGTVSVGAFLVCHVYHALL